MQGYMNVKNTETICICYVGDGFDTVARYITSTEPAVRLNVTDSSALQFQCMHYHQQCFHVTFMGILTEIHE